MKSSQKARTGSQYRFVLREVMRTSSLPSKYTDPALADTYAQQLEQMQQYQNLTTHGSSWPSYTIKQGEELEAPLGWPSPEITAKTIGAGRFGWRRRADAVRIADSIASSRSLRRGEMRGQPGQTDGRFAGCGELDSQLSVRKARLGHRRVVDLYYGSDFYVETWPM
jgi:hypothetical protein